MILPDFNKFYDKLVPAIIQDWLTGRVLMLGYMSEASYQQTLAEQRVVFFSRYRQEIWVKGAASGNYLYVKEILTDCDNDCLLIKARPAGPICHTGADTCFNEVNNAPFLPKLEALIRERKETPVIDSYISSLFGKGINKIAQKVGEEAVELVIEAKDDNDDLFRNEAADLLFHYLILLQSRNVTLKDIEQILLSRHQQRASKQ
jgi:phosphoribosyl-AMP cyclohydrolase / phosphoribosyl-ATP pyrophosphohydrolase